MYVSLEYFASGDRQDRTEPALVRNSGHADCDNILRWMYSAIWMDESVVTSKKCWIGIERKMPEISEK